MVDLLQCLKCLELKTPDAFYRRNDRKGLYRRACKKCMCGVEVRECRICKVWTNDFKGHSVICNQCNRLDGTKYCVTCLIEKPLSEFHYRKDREHWSSFCKTCASKRGIENRRQSLHGMSYEEYKNRVLLQESKCKICGQEYSPLCVDHLKGTTLVRDLLCDSCNLALGLFKENLVSMRKAIEYLEFWKSHGDSV